MIGKGYKTAFVVADKGAKRVTLPEAGVNPEDLPDNYNEDNEIASFVEPRDTSSTTGPANTNTFDMSQVKFRVLLTSTTSDLSNEELDILSNIGNVKVVKEFDGSFKYYSQQFENKEEAIKGWEGYKEYGLDNMSIIYEYNGEFLTEEEFKAKTNQ